MASKYIPGRSHFPHLLHTRSIVIFCRVSHCHCRCQWLFSFDLSSQNTSQTQTALHFHPIIRLYYGVYTLLKHNKQLTKQAGEFILHEFVIVVLSISCYRSSVQICSLISRYRWYTTNVRWLRNWLGNNSWRTGREKIFSIQFLHGHMACCYDYHLY